MLSKQTAGRTQIGPGHFRELVCGIFGRQSVGSAGGSFLLSDGRQNGGFFEEMCVYSIHVYLI